MKLGLINSAWAQAGKGTAFGNDVCPVACVAGCTNVLFSMMLFGRMKRIA